MKSLLKTAAVCVFFIAGFCPAALGFDLPQMEDKTLSMDLQNANLKDVLKIFSIQSGLNFIAAQTVEDRKITLYLEKVPIKEGMTRLFEANNLTYDYDEAANLYVVKYWGEPQVDVLTKIYKLRNRSVSSAKLVMEASALMAESGMGEGLKSSNSVNTPDEKESMVDTVKQVLSKEGKISEDRRTNSLIITDIPSRFPVIDELIARLDIAQPMVLLEVEMLDVSRSALDNLGPSLGSQDSANPLTVTVKSHRVDLFAGLSANLAKEGYLTLGKNYALLLNFLKTQTDTRYLARPKIMTLNNETAEIGVTRDEVVNTKRTLSTPEGGGTTVDSIEFERATSLSLTPEGIGVFLRVTPQVNLETNEITMVVNPKSSSTSQSPLLGSTAGGGSGESENLVALDPEVRMTKSIVKVKDGETIVLGGLIHKENQVIINKIPILGDIPFVGLLFRNKKTSKDQDRELLVFITPRIISDPATRLARSDDSKYALQYLSSGSKRKQEISNLLDVFEEK